MKAEKLDLADKAVFAQVYDDHVDAIFRYVLGRLTPLNSSACVTKCKLCTRNSNPCAVSWRVNNPKDYESR